MHIEYSKNRDLKKTCEVLSPPLKKVSLPCDPKSSVPVNVETWKGFFIMFYDTRVLENR